MTFSRIVDSDGHQSVCRVVTEECRAPPLPCPQIERGHEVKEGKRGRQKSSNEATATTTGVHLSPVAAVAPATYREDEESWISQSLPGHRLRKSYIRVQEVTPNNKKQKKKSKEQAWPRSIPKTRRVTCDYVTRTQQPKKYRKEKKKESHTRRCSLVS
ncbi:hypothetical protein KQX54_019778 [Cotesia glomerata]|uniref:Uncharacterized protein n=1 Tax=Cotesia glomerata TaxID=32391 RepID=A0AAV7J8G7_COTGL|nr:hypothetical protein KQX54_019778 [Cotesia glomerata]